MSDEAPPSPGQSPRAQGRVLKAVAKTWPVFIAGAVEGRARKLIDDDRHEEAATVLEQGIARFGPDTVSQLLLAWCLFMAARNGDAIRWAEKAVEEEPENADAHWLRANVLFELERPDEAVQALWEAVELTPDNGRYYMQLAWARYEDEDFATTRGLVEQALERSPDDVWVRHTAGRIFDHHLRHRRAHAQYERVLELEPGNAGARCDLAEVLQSRGRLSAGVRAAWETVTDPGLDRSEDETNAEEVYDATLRRWSWRWFEWALRAALLLNVIDWIVPTPGPAGAVPAGTLVAAFAAGWARSLLVLPKPCRKDLVAAGRRAHSAVASLLLALTLAGTAAMLVGELSGLQHSGVLGLIAGGYLLWFWRAARISGRRLFGPDE
jgi:tetratricopeptide (TPR) repeat protein